MEVQDQRIPVTIISGFLGSGKTTFINQLIQQKGQRKIAIIENEFGEINIDSALIIHADKSVYELSEGCICCTLNGALENLLYDLLDKKDSFDHLIIETTGVADPGVIALTFLNDFGIQTNYRLDGIVCMVDALNVLRQIDEIEELHKQISVADHLVLTKTERGKDEDINQILVVLQKINPSAKQYIKNTAEYTQTNWFDLGSYKSSTIEAQTKNWFEIDKSKSAFTHTNKFESVAIEMPGEIHPIYFDNWITKILFSMNLYRVKAILNMAMYDRKFIFQSVSTQFVSELGSAWGEEPRINRIVFIGKNLDKERLEKEFGTCVMK